MKVRERIISSSPKKKKNPLPKDIPQHSATTTAYYEGNVKLLFLYFLIFILFLMLI
jgi:hypothetical protein